LELAGDRHGGEHANPHVERAFEADESAEMSDATS
jgi:hypothetical protein